MMGGTQLRGKGRTITKPRYVVPLCTERTALHVQAFELADLKRILEGAVWRRMHTRPFVGADERTSEPDMPDTP
jgi:hypothetical protein